MVRFLRFVVEHAIEERREPLKEYLIGVSVFDKTPDFDPKSDPLVRVEARRLRAKLRDYYSGEGRNDVVLIELAERGYSPVFTRRVAAAEQVRARRRRLWAVLATIGALLATAAVSRQLITYLRPTASPDHWIVVLPFADLSPQKDEEYFSDGLTDEIINALTAVKGLNVIARTSAFHFKGRAEDVRGIARQLGADLVLEGSVRKELDHVRVSAQLIDAASGTHLWSQQFDRKLTAILDIQEEIARAIADKFRLDLPASDGGEFVRGRTNNSESYNLYLRGRHAWFQFTPETAQKSIELFQRAITLDPNFAVAHAELAFAFLQLTNLRALPAADLVPKARASAINALRADPGFSDAHAALGAANVFEWDWKGAEQEFRRALELNPNSFRTRFDYATLYLRALGRFSDAAAELEKLRLIDPLSPAVNGFLGRVLIEDGRFDEGLQQLTKAAEVDPNYTPVRLNLGQAYLGKSMCAEALREFGRARTLGGDAPYIVGHLGYAQALCGNRAEAKKLLRQLLDRRPLPESDAARIFAGLGDKNAAFACLRRAAAQRDSTLVFLRGDHAYGALPSDPRFKAFLFGTLGLPR